MCNFSNHSCAQAMNRKYKMPEEEILRIWEDFHSKHPDGLMTKESFLDSKEVSMHSGNRLLLFGFLG